MWLGEDKGGLRGEGVCCESEGKQSLWVEWYVCACVKNVCTCVYVLVSVCVFVLVCVCAC